ncbi:hypothetical protein BACCAC_03785 [Bacteroides caccae ATCC 43185]|nr:hypothetical protein BACCAC_03785 [Bacteroides caccae ATCC 43185]
MAAYCISQTASIHRLLCGLPGYLILFDTHTFEHQRQLHSSELPSQSEFFVISKHFTATPRIPPTSTALKTASINCNFTVEPQTFTTDLTIRLRSL